MIRYHDEEWGIPVHDEIRLFEMLSLEGAQAGLSWSTILNRRPAYRRAFAGFDPELVANFGADDVQRLVGDQSIVRHRGKIEAVVSNARVVTDLHRRGERLDALIWEIVGGRPLQPRYSPGALIPATTPTAIALGTTLRRLGMRFVGPTTAQSLLQACGFTNDHTIDCFRHRQLDI